MKDGNYTGRATGRRIDNNEGDVRFGRGPNGEQIAVRIKNEHDEPTWFVGSFASDKAVEITVRQLRDMGARIADGDVFDLEGLGDKEFPFRVYSEEYPVGSGTMKQKVAIGGGNFKFKDELDGGGMEALRQRLRGRILATGQKGAVGGAALEADVPDF